MAANPPGAPPPPPPPPPSEATPTTSLIASSQSNPGLSGVNSTTRSPIEPKPSSMSPTAKPAKPRYKEIISSNYRQGTDNQYPSEQNRCETKGAMWPHASSSGVKDCPRNKVAGYGYNLTGKVKVDSGNQDELNELIKCMVCGDTSTGFHYGIHSCEGCKGFFRRSLTQHESYTCSNNGQCDISLYTRNQCQLCRWKKCLAVGMSKEGSRLGRRSKRMIEKMHETIAKQRSVGDSAVKTAGFYGNHPDLFSAGKFGPQMPTTSMPGMMHSQGPPMLPHSMASAMYGAMNMNMMNMNANMNMGGGFPGLAGMMGDGTVPPSAIMSHAQSISTIIKQELEQQSDREHSLSETSSISGMDMSPPASVSRQSSVPGINEACSSSVNGSRFGEGSDQSPTISSVSLPMKSSEDDRTGLKRPSDCVHGKNEDEKVDNDDVKSARGYGGEESDIDMGAISKMLASGQPVILIPKEMREGSNAKDVLMPQNPTVMVVPQKGKQGEEARARSKSASPGNYNQSELMGAPYSAFHPQHHRDEKSAAAAYAQLHAKGGAGSQFFQFPGCFPSQQLPQSLAAHHLPHSSLLPMSQAAWSSLSSGRPHLPPSPLMPSVSLAQPIPSSTAQQVSAYLSHQHLKSEVHSPKSSHGDMHDSPRHHKHGSPGKMHPATDLTNKSKNKMDSIPDFSALSPPIPSPLAAYALANSPHSKPRDEDGIEKISVKEEPRSNSEERDQREAMETLALIAPPGYNPDEPLTPELKKKLQKIIDSVNKSYHDTCFYTFRRIRFLRERYFPFLGEDTTLHKRLNPKYEHDCSKCTPPNGFPTVMDPPKELNFDKKKLDGSKMWQFFSSKFTSQITRIVNFSKMIPGFKHLDREDQITLIKTGLFEVATIRFSTVADTATNMVYWWTTGDMFSLEDAHQMPLGNLFDLLFDFSRRVNKMYLDDCEYALLSALVIMSPDRPGLKNRDRIRLLQLDLLRALNMELADNHPNDHGLFARLLTTIPKLREIGPEHTRRLMELKIRSPDVNFPPLHAEVFDLNSS